MKTRVFLTFVSAISILQAVSHAQTNVYEPHIAGYVHYTFWSGGSFQAGDNLFGNPLLNTSSRLSTIIPDPSSGTTVSLWDPVVNAFTQSSTFANGVWSLNLELPPGQGALLTTFTTFTNTFYGVVLAPDGSILNPDEPIPPPPAFDRPDGVYLLSSKLPATLSSSLPVFDYILGRSPREGEQFTRLDPLTQLSHTTTFVSGNWDNGIPVLPLGEAAFFKVVPEVSTWALLLLGSIAMGIVAQRRKYKLN